MIDSSTSSASHPLFLAFQPCKPKPTGFLIKGAKEGSCDLWKKNNNAHQVLPGYSIYFHLLFYKFTITLQFLTLHSHKIFPIIALLASL